MSSRYVYICVRTPIEIKPDGERITHNEYTQVDFEECAELPALADIDVTQAFHDYLEKPIATQQEQTLAHTQEPEPAVEPIVLKSEIKDKRAPLQNCTFKNKSSSSSKHSRKVRCEL
jgi:hypothetical protein